MNAQSSAPNKKPNLSSIFDLIIKAQNASDVLELNFLLVNLTKQLVSYQQAILYREGKGFQAISGLSDIDNNSPMLIWLKQFIYEIELQKISGQCLIKNFSNKTQKNFREWFSGEMAVFPFLHLDKDNFGYLLLIRDDSFDDEEIKALFFWLNTWTQSLKLLENPYTGNKLSLFERMNHKFIAFKELAPKIIIRFFDLAQKKINLFFKGGYRNLFKWETYQSFGQSFKKRYHEDKKFRWKFYALIVFFLPLRLSIIAPGEIVASHPILIRAPIEGVIEKFYVEPNSLVKQGQNLFSYDNASLIAKAEAAKQSFLSAEAEYRQNTMLSLSDPKQKANLAILKTKVEEKKADYEFLAGQVKRSEVNAPIDSWAIFDDPAEQVGKPIMVGEKIMMLADPKEVEIQAWISLNDMIELKRGNKVILYPNTNPFSAVEARIKYITYEPVQLPEGHYAYRLRAMIIPNQAMPRLGIKGTVKVSGNIVPLSYWVLRKPLAQIRQFIGI